MKSATIIQRTLAIFPFVALFYFPPYPYSPQCFLDGTNVIASKDNLEQGGGMVSVAAGSGQKGLLDGAKETARFDWPTGVAVDRNGNLFVTDHNNNVIRKIYPSGWVETFSGRGGSRFCRRGRFTGEIPRARGRRH